MFILIQKVNHIPLGYSNHRDVGRNIIFQILLLFYCFKFIITDYHIILIIITYYHFLNLY